MCGRFSITGDLDFYAEYYGVDEVAADRLEPNWNVAPTDPVYVVAERDGRRVLGTMRWGLVPHFAGNGKRIQINVRIETVDSSPALRGSFAGRRCLIPADGFYEWEPPATGRKPHWVYRADGHPMSFAGIWATRRIGDDWNRTCSILTTEAVGTIGRIHDRMPVCLSAEHWETWLDRSTNDPGPAWSLVGPVDPDLIIEHPVSRRVNTVANNDAGLQLRAEPDTLF